MNLDQDEKVSSGFHLQLLKLIFVGCRKQISRSVGQVLNITQSFWVIFHWKVEKSSREVAKVSSKPQQLYVTPVDCQCRYKGACHWQCPVEDLECPLSEFMGYNFAIFYISVIWVNQIVSMLVQWHNLGSCLGHVWLEHCTEHRWPWTVGRGVS